MEENARNVSIIINPPDDLSRNNWKSIFRSILHIANTTSGFQNSWAELTPDGVGGDVVFRVMSPYDGNGVTVEYNEVDVNIILQPVGWQGS